MLPDMRFPGSVYYTRGVYCDAFYGLLRARMVQAAALDSRPIKATNIWGKFFLSRRLIILNLHDFHKPLT